MTDKPEKRTHKWTRPAEDPIYSGELLLPSFGIRVTRSDPAAWIHPPGPYGSFALEEPDSSDACSVSYLSTKIEVSVADQRFLHLDPGYLRRILLRILDGEEFLKFEHHHREMKYWTIRPGLPEGQAVTFGDMRLVSAPEATSEVRLTDLRLATELRSKDLERELKQVLPSLQLPVTKESVTRWKWETLTTCVTALKDHSQPTETKEYIKTISVSFAAAALLLLHDLDMNDLKDAGHDALGKSIIGLARIVTGLSETVEGSVTELSKLLAPKRERGGNLPDPEAKDYSALVRYRMGHDLKSIASRIGINPRTEQDGELRGSKNWKPMVCERIRRGVEVEKKRFPQAVAVLANSRDKSVQTEAKKAYIDYSREMDLALGMHHIDWLDEVDPLLNIPLDAAEEVRSAHIQLGSCLTKGIELFGPTTV